MEKTAMSGTVNRTVASIAIMMAFVLSACTEKKSEDTLAQDTALNRDLQMANADTAAQPQLKDIPAGTVAPAPIKFNVQPQGGGTALFTDPQALVGEPIGVTAIA